MGDSSLTLKDIWNTAATTKPTALEFKPGSALLYHRCVRNAPQKGKTP